MPNWEVWDRRRKPRSPRFAFPTITIHKGGRRLSFNTFAMETMGYPMYAEFLLDPNADTIAIRPLREYDVGHPHAFRLGTYNKGTACIESAALDGLWERFDFSFPETVRYAAELQDGLLVVDFRQGTV